MKIKRLLMYVLSFVLAFIFLFSFLLALLNCLKKFGLLGADGFLLITSVISAALALFYVFFVAKRIKAIKESRIGFWFDNNYPKIILGYIILLLFLTSVTEKVIWTTSEIIDLLKLEWTILGFSLTIFLVWNVLIVDYLQKKQPISEENPDYFQKYAILLKKQSFSQEVEATVSKTVLLSINLILLLLSSTLIYLIRKPELLFTQNVVCCTFYFSTNTILSLFLDMLKPIYLEKDRLKKQNSVTKHDLDSAKAEALLQPLIESGLKEINQSEDLTDAAKKELSSIYEKRLRDALQDLQKRKKRKKEPSKTVKNDEKEQPEQSSLTEDESNGKAEQL